MHLTQTEENYLKAIFTISEREGSSVGTNSIAHAINTSASSVTDMLKKLAEKKLILYEKYKPVILSALGTQTATHLIRKHRLWETFLVENLGFNWSEVHIIAEQMEHIKSPELVQKLDDYLGNPMFDPHGDPIPNEKGEFPQRNHQLLSTLSNDQVGTLSSVLEDDRSFLEILNKLKIKIGTKIKIVELVEFDESMHVVINSCDSILLSKKLCDNLYVIKN